MPERNFREDGIADELIDIADWLADKYGSEVSITFVNSQGCHTFGKLSPKSIVEWGANTINIISKISPVLLLEVLDELHNVQKSDDSIMEITPVPKQ